jgi:hypothetical protein
LKLEESLIFKLRGFNFESLSNILMTLTRKRMFVALGITVAVAVLSCILASSSEIAFRVSYYIFWGLGPVCLVSFIAGFIYLFTGEKKLGLWLIITSVIVVAAFYCWVLIICGN